MYECASGHLDTPKGEWQPQSWKEAYQENLRPLSVEAAPSFPSHLSPPSSLVSTPPHQRWHTAHIRSPHLLPLEPTRPITPLLMSMSCSPALLLPQTQPLGPGSSLGGGWVCVCVVRVSVCLPSRSGTGVLIVKSVWRQLWMQFRTLEIKVDWLFEDLCQDFAEQILHPSPYRTTPCNYS